MRRSVTRRIELRGLLTCTSALSVGGWGEGAFADTVVARDGRGRPIVPGTALAGVLRSWYARRHDEAEACRVFGFVQPKTQKASVSRIRVDDAPLVPEHAALVPEIRDGVGIDRHTGAAEQGKLFTREVLPAGTRFTFALTAEESADEPVRSVVEELGSALARGEISVGGRTSLGLGRVVLHEATIAVSELGSRAGLLAWLRDGPSVEPFEPTAPATGGILRVEIEWRPEHAILVRDSASGRGVDVLPLTAADTDTNRRVRLLIPGSTIKGCLRAQAERIVRSLFEDDAASPGPDDPATSGRGAPRLLPAVTGLFGAGPAEGEGGDLPTGYRGALTAHDCHSRGHLDAAAWEAVRWATPGATGAAETGPAADAPLTDAAPSDPDRNRDTVRRLARNLTGEVRLTVSDHVAVDRWTGGAARRRLFSLLEPMGTAWQPLTLTVDTRPCPDPGEETGHVQSPEDPDLLDPDLQLVLLLLVLRDLAEGWIPLGAATTRGLGHLTASRVTFHGEGLIGPWGDLTGRTLDEVLAARPPAVERAWTAWLRRVSSTTEGRRSK